jgi:SAM-dependent methyltransferase
VQTDGAALARLLDFAALPEGARVLDAGCGPGLVSETLLGAGHRLHGVDLSGEMILRARRRCARFGERSRFEQLSVFDPRLEGGFDAALSRFVLHHAPDPGAFIRRQAELLRAGGILVASDHTTDPDPERAGWHQDLEHARDRTHARSLTAGDLLDLLASAGLSELRLSEEPFELDFDEWFDRGTPEEPKSAVRAKLLSGRARGFEPALQPNGAIRIRCWRALARGVKP